MFRLTDTRTRQLETIEPSRPGLLRMYACGPTVYRYAHVGNLRTFLLHDLISRTAEVVHGWRVDLVQNITDVGHLVDDDAIDAAGEDKILSTARAEGRSAWDIARFYEAQWRADCAALNIRPARVTPRASESIDLIRSLIETLLSRGHAYVGDDGSVFFDARSFPSYGAISGNRLEDLRAGHGVAGESTATGKRFHADWALWKGAPDRSEMVWDMPWGRGFPGWHIECSAMSLHHLGTTFDIHTAGVDLRFPHHEDERAQSNAAVGHEVVARWVHGEHLLAEGRKMSKSTGNVVLVSDLVERGLDPLALRLFFLTGRYRQQVNMTWDALTAADKRLSRWRAKVAGWAESPSRPMCAEMVQGVYDAFDDDLDTPTALKVLAAVERDPSLPDGSKFETFAHLDRLFGLDLTRLVGAVAGDLPGGAAELLSRRQEARAAKDFATSDALRDELSALGVTVTDTADGQQWTVA